MTQDQPLAAGGGTPPRAMLLCDVCDGAIPAGRKTYELKGGGTCCEACYQRLTARPAVFAITAAPARSARTAPTRLKRYEKVSLGRRRTSGKAVASLVLGILSLVSSFMCPGVILSALAMVFGTLALAEMKRNRAIEGRGLAQAGLIIGVIYDAPGHCGDCARDYGHNYVVSLSGPVVAVIQGG